MATIKEQFDNLKLPPIMDDDTAHELYISLQNLAFQYIKNIDDIDNYRSTQPHQFAKLLDTSIPSGSLSTKKIIEFVSQLLPYFPATHSKNFLGYIPSDPSKLSVLLASLTPYFNQFTGSVQGSPSGVAVEIMVIRWISSLLGYPDSSFGTFTSGGSMANLTAIYTGISHQLSKYGVNYRQDGIIGSRRPVIYFSDQTHNAIEKTLLVLGLGQKSMRKLPTNDKYQLTAAIAKAAIHQDLKDPKLLPLMIIATAGTTNTGSIDHLDDLYELSMEYNLWLHVDGAYGAFSRLAKTGIASETMVMSKVNSIALDCHKWFFTPFEAGIALVRDHRIMKSAFELTAEYIRDSELDEDYLQRNFRSYSIQLTREMRGLKVWGVFASLGLEGIKNAITRDILKADYLRQKIEEHPDFYVVPGGKLSIVCFGYLHDDKLNDKIVHHLNAEGKFFTSTTRLGDLPIIRICFLNRRSDLETVDILFDNITKIAFSLSQ